MPNWCENNVVFRHSDPAQIKRIVNFAPSNGLFQTFFPCPSELELNAFNNVGVMRIKYGFDSWYDFALDNWGAKSDVELFCYEISSNSVRLTFDTAWGPPIKFYEKMMEIGFEVEAKYSETGMCFVGEFSNDNKFHLNYHSAKEIPEEYIEMFSLQYLFEEDYEE